MLIYGSTIPRYSKDGKKKIDTIIYIVEGEEDE